MTEKSEQSRVAADGRRSRRFIWGMTGLVVLVFVAVGALVYYAGLSSPMIQNQKQKAGVAPVPMATLPQEQQTVQGVSTQVQSSATPGTVTVVGPDSMGLPPPAAVPPPAGVGSAASATVQLQGASSGVGAAVSQTVQNTVQTACGVASLVTSNCPVRP